MKIYFAGYGKGDGSIDNAEYIDFFRVINKLFSFYNDKGVMKIFFAGNQEWNNEQLLTADRILRNRLLSYYYLSNYQTFDGQKKEMKLYFAGGENKQWLDAINTANGKKSLYSYFYLDKDNGKNIEPFLEKAIKTQKNIFIDSGGFSAWSKGVSIDIGEYADFLFKYHNQITTYANLDSIGDMKQTMINQKYLESRGLSPLPVFHFGEDYGLLRDLVSNYKYIALGGMVPIARNRVQLFKFLDSCFSIIQDRIKVHGFGMTGVQTLKRYPFYSVDSTTWLGGSMRAEVYQFDSIEGTMKCIPTTIKEKANYKTIKFTDNRDKRWMIRVINNAIEWQKFETYITNLWTKRGVIWND